MHLKRRIPPKNLTPTLPRKRDGVIWELMKHKTLYLMFLPGTVLLLLFSYLPMSGLIIAFKDYNFEKGIFGSPWAGFKNFEFFLKSPDSWRIIRNTLSYNVVFIILGLIVSVSVAIMLHELIHRKLSRFYQSVIFMPYFLSWMVVTYIAYSLLHPEHGLMNRTILSAFGIEGISWYTEKEHWPFILTFFNVWKYTGFGMIIYVASLAGIDHSYYEAAAIDGAGKWKQTLHITVPLLTPMMVILTILNIGRIFNADFGLFFNVTLNTGIIKPTTEVIDTYVYNALMTIGDVGMASAASFFQSIVGFTLVVVTNWIVRKINAENALY